MRTVGILVTLAVAGCDSPASSGEDDLGGPDLPSALCGDGVKDGSESDVDCGGPICPLCLGGEAPA